MSLQKTETLLKLHNLQDGEHLYFNMFQDGGAVIERKGDVYSLSEVPLYGGNEMWFADYTLDQLPDAYDVSISWT